MAEMLIAPELLSDALFRDADFTPDIIGAS